MMTLSEFRKILLIHIWMIGLSTMQESILPAKVDICPREDRVLEVNSLDWGWRGIKVTRELTLVLQDVPI